jgi:UDP-3-O-[3-hydroxymyristoyl] glucosamine N-acyltransferase
MAPPANAAPGRTLVELAALTGARVEGDGSVRVERVATLTAAAPASIAFLANPKYRSQLAGTRATAVILAPPLAAATTLPRLLAANPYALYARVAQILHPPAVEAAGVHPTAVVEAGAQVAASATVGPGAWVATGAVIGERARIGAGSTVGAGSTIGADTLLHPRVSVYHGCRIGPRCILHSGVVVGADGFGMAEDAGRWIKIPQVGGVTIGADVEIGANTTIDRGAIDDTVIEDDVKLDNQIQVAHNCRIGAHTAIAGCVGMAGSTTIGRNCKIGGAAMISGHLEIPDGTVISGGTLVPSSIAEAGVYTSVFPLLTHREWRHVASELRQLRTLARRLRALEHPQPRQSAPKPAQEDQA